MSQTVKQGFFYASLLTVALMVLKVCDRIDWHWKWIMSPIGFVFTLALSVWTLRYCANLGQYLDERYDEQTDRPYREK
jgi:hypothetical protein